MRKLLLFCAACALLAVGCSSKDATTADATTTGGTTATTTPPAKTPADTSTPGATPVAGGTGYTAVQAIFTKNCAGCHGGPKGKGGIDLTSYEGAMKGGAEGPIVKAGDPDGSVLVQALHGTGGKKQMPPKGALPADDIKTIESWIKDGAKKA